jgi:hypothetical protein
MAISVCIVTLPGADATQSFPARENSFKSGCRRLLPFLLYGGTSCHKHIILTNLLIVNNNRAYLLDKCGEENEHRFKD